MADESPGEDAFSKHILRLNEFVVRFGCELQSLRKTHDHEVSLLRNENVHLEVDLDITPGGDLGAEKIDAVHKCEHTLIKDEIAALRRFPNPPDASLEDGLKGLNPREKCSAEGTTTLSSPEPALELRRAPTDESVSHLEIVGESSPDDDAPLAAPGCVEARGDKTLAAADEVRDRPMYRLQSLQHPPMPVFALRPEWVSMEDLLATTSRQTPELDTDYLNKSRLKQWSMRWAAHAQACFDEQHQGHLPLHPQCLRRLAWDLLALLLMGHDLIMLPLAVFDLPSSPERAVLEHIFLGYWTLDVGMSCMTGCHMNGRLTMQWRQIILNYLQTWFAFDMIVLVPQWLAVLASSGGVKSVILLRALRGGRALRYMKFFRLLRLVKMDKVITDLRSNVNSATILLWMTIGRLIFVVIILCHMLSSAWYFIGKLSSNGWVYVEGINQRTLADRYLYTFQWSIARLHPSSFGKNDSLQSTEERLFAICVSMLALGGGGYFVSCITNEMAQLKSLRHAQTRKMFVVREYIRCHSISLNLAMRIKSYVMKTLSQKLQMTYAKELTEFLPAPLVADLRFETWSPVLSNHAFFMKLTMTLPRLIWCLCKEALEEVAVLPGDTVFTTGDSCSRMYFVFVGELTYAPGRLMGVGKCILDEVVRLGQWLSEPALWTVWEHRGELAGHLESSLLTIDVEALMNVAQLHDKGSSFLTLYARKFVSVLQERAESDMITDLLPNLPDEVELEQPLFDVCDSKKRWSVEVG
eukprot:TRINITY_DN14491_c0_g1_i2.p1 TRINITY_DN14491_c0_g1~~TRINITY_DN14491_c0_g1_i2.p1  ORF type:complete len:773 (-),score=75.49 TRINITY_DN14491_c0_g1_i2:438-2696(-)